MGECILNTALRVILFFRLEDYLLCLVCGLVAFGLGKARPYCRSFSWTDGAIDYPYGGVGTFPSWSLPLIAILPAVAYVLCEAVRHLWWEQRSPTSPSHNRSRSSASQELSSAARKQRGTRPRAVNDDTAVSLRDVRDEVGQRHDGGTEFAAASSFPFPTPPQPPSMVQPIMVEVASAEEEAEEQPQASVATALEANTVVWPTPEKEGEAFQGGTATAEGRRLRDPSTQGAAQQALSASVASPVRVVSSPGLTNRTVAASHAGPASLLGQALRSESAYVSRAPSSHHSNAGVLPYPSSSLSTIRHRRVSAGVGFAVPLRAPWQRFLVHAHMWVLTQAFSVTLAMLVVDAIKVYAGRLRPDFLARLRREGYNETSTGVDWCAAGKGGRVSFPSGHSAISFAAFVPFTFYVLHMLRVFRRGGVPLWRIVLGLVPQILPITVAVSRTRDYRHNFDDVLAGSLIGIACALIAVRANLVVKGKSGELMPRLAALES
jgi:membrane-associated phospholipid phosphatase